MIKKYSHSLLQLQEIWYNSILLFFGGYANSYNSALQQALKKSGDFDYHYHYNNNSNNNNNNINSNSNNNNIKNNNTTIMHLKIQTDNYGARLHQMLVTDDNKFSRNRIKPYGSNARCPSVQLIAL